MLNKRGKTAVAIFIAFIVFLIFVVWLSWNDTSITGNVLERTGSDCVKSGGNDARYAGVAKINRMDFPDKCVNSSTLKEYYCGNNSENLYYDLIDCNCRDGVCVPDVECVEGKNKLITIYEKGQIKFQFQNSCVLRNNQSVLMKYSCSDFEPYDVEEQLNQHEVEKLVKKEELCYLSDQHCDEKELSCKYRLGVDTEPRLSVFPPKIDLDKSITITLIDIALTNEIRTVDVFVDAGQNKPINKALYYENDGLYRATYKVISDECLKEGKCNPSSIPVSSGNVMITYNSKTGKAYSEGFNVVMPQKEFVSSLLSKASPVQEIPEIMSLDELKNALDLLNNFESYFIVKGAKNISNIDLDISNSKEAGRFNTNLFGLSLFSFSEDAKRECDVICSRFDNSTSLFDNKINSFNDLKSNQLDMDDLCSCNCKGSVDVSINCREIVRRAYKKASIVN